MSNSVSLTHDAAERCAAACSKFVAEVLAVRDFVDNNAIIEGFGTLPSGVALNAKYTELTSGGAGSLTSTLQGHIDVVTKLADTFRRMGEQYAETDDAVATSLRPSDTGGR